MTAAARPLGTAPPEPPISLVVVSAADLANLIRDAVADALEASRSPTLPTLLDREGCAEWLQVSTRTLDTMRGRGLPQVMLGDSPRFEPAAVLEWLRDQKLAVLASAGEKNSAEKQPDSRADRRRSDASQRTRQVAVNDFAALHDGPRSAGDEVRQ